MSGCLVEINLAEREAGSVEPAAYLPGEMMTVDVVVEVEEAIRCEGLDLSCRVRGEGKGFAPQIEGWRVRVFEGEWAPGRHTYRRQMPAPQVAPTFHGDWVQVDWWVEAHADIPWSKDVYDRERFHLRTPKMSVVDLVLPPPEDASDLARMAEARRSRDRNKAVAGRVLDVVGGIAIFAVFLALVLRYAIRMPEAVWSPLLGPGSFVGGAYVLLQLLGYASKRLGPANTAPLDVAVTIERGVPDTGYRQAHDLEDAVTVTAWVDPDATIDAISAKLEVDEFTEWTEGSGDNRRERSFSLTLYRRTETMQPTGAPGEYRAVLELAELMALTVLDAGGHGIVWRVQIDVVHSGGKAPEESIRKTLEAHPRRVQSG